MTSPPLHSFHQAGRTVRVLALLSERAYSAPEVAEVLDVADPTARRLLKRLALDGFVEETGVNWHRYRLGPAAFTLGLLLVRVSTQRAVQGNEPRLPSDRSP